MKKYSRLIITLITIIAISGMFVACDGKNEGDVKNEEVKEAVNEEKEEVASEVKDEADKEGEKQADEENKEEAATESDKKDTLVVLSSEAFSGGWDPAGHTVLANVHLQEAVYSYLIKLNYETYEYEPGLATSWEYDEDGYSLVLKLREGVKFHDGSDFDAKDVKATIEWMSRPDSARGADWGEQYLVDIIDDYTVKVYPSSKEPRAPLMNLLTYYESPIMSSEDIENEKLADGLNGTGPYKMVKYEDETCYLEAFEDFYDKENAAKIKFLEYSYVPESQTRLAALLSGEADIIERVESEQLPQIENNEDVDILSAPVFEQKYLVFKCTQAPMDNPTLRKAIAYAIDVDTIVENILEGKAVKADSWLSHASPNYSTHEGFPSYNPEKAKELLAEAGYPNGEGLPTLKYITSTGFYPKTKEYGEYIVSNLKDIGINVELEVQESGAWSESLYAEDSCHMIDTGWMIGNEDNEQIAACFNEPRGLMDFSTDKVVFAAVAKETATTDPELRKQVIKDELWPALNDSMSTYPLFDSVMIWAYRKDVQGFKAYPTSNIQFNELSFK